MWAGCALMTRRARGREERQGRRRGLMAGTAALCLCPCLSSTWPFEPAVHTSALFFPSSLLPVCSPPLSSPNTLSLSLSLILTPLRWLRLVECQRRSWRPGRPCRSGGSRRRPPHPPRLVRGRLLRTPRRWVARFSRTLLAAPGKALTATRRGGRGAVLVAASRAHAGARLPPTLFWTPLAPTRSLSPLPFSPRSSHPSRLSLPCVPRPSVRAVTFDRLNTCLSLPPPFLLVSLIFLTHPHTPPSHTPARAATACCPTDGSRTAACSRRVQEPFQGPLFARREKPSPPLRRVGGAAAVSIARQPALVC